MPERCEACHGMRRDLSGQVCAVCGGRGLVIANPRPCLDCHGTGKKQTQHYSVYGGYVDESLCLKCNGTGLAQPAIPYTDPPRIIPASSLRVALNDLIRGRFAHADDALLLHGLVAGLAFLAIDWYPEMEGADQARQRWLDDLLSRGTLVYDGSGIIHLYHDSAVQIVRFDLERDTP